MHLRNNSTINVIDLFAYPKSVTRYGVISVGPDLCARGGIAAVIRNYEASQFWAKCNCTHFSTYMDYGSKWCRVAYSLWRYLPFLATLSVRRPSVVSIHTGANGSYYRKWCYILLARLFGVRVILHVHPDHFGDFYEQGNALERQMVRVGFALSDRVVFLNASTLKRLQTVCPGIPRSVVANPVDMAYFGGVPRSRMAQNHQILFMGAFVKEKGIMELLDAVPLVLRRFPKVQFVIAGTGCEGDLNEAIHSRGIGTSVHVLGWVEGDAKRDLLVRSRVLVLPSYSEGMPNVILEAMAAGLPAITTPVGGIPEIFVEGVNGYFVRPRDSTGLGSRICSMLGDDADCERIAESTRKWAESRFDLPKIARELEAIYLPYVTGESSA